MANGVELHRARSLAVAIACVAELASAPARADGTNEGAAQALFDEGRRLMREGDLAAACAKLAESERLAHAGGTLLNLAACHERQNKTATAWSEFKDALAEAIRDGRTERIEEARARIADLEGRLARLEIVVDAQGPKPEILLDGTSLGQGAWGTPFPVDPGAHEVRASSPGHAPWRVVVEAAPEKTTRVTVKLVPLARPREQKNTKVGAYVLGGVGLAAVGVGAYFGVDAANKHRDTQALCGAAGCQPRASSLNDDAKRAAWISDIGFGVGLAAAGVAAFLFVRSSTGTNAKSATVRSGPMLAPGAVGWSAGGAF